MDRILCISSWGLQKIYGGQYSLFEEYSAIYKLKCYIGSWFTYLMKYRNLYYKTKISSIFMAKKVLSTMCTYWLFSYCCSFFCNVLIVLTPPGIWENDKTGWLSPRCVDKPGLLLFLSWNVSWSWHCLRKR